MKQYLPILAQATLFTGIAQTDLLQALSCMGAQLREVKEGAFVLRAGDVPRFIGVVLTGQFAVAREDADGNRVLLAALAPGELFAETLCCAGVPESPVSVTAAQDSVYLALDFSALLHTCPKGCAFHTQLIANMLQLLAHKNLHLQSRIEILSLKSIRSKVLLYLQGIAPAHGSEIVLPFGREEMAAYLGVERTALSHELAKMRADGLLTFRKNVFWVM